MKSAGAVVHLPTLRCLQLFCVCKHLQLLGCMSWSGPQCSHALTEVKSTGEVLLKGRPTACVHNTVCKLDKAWYLVRGETSVTAWRWALCSAPNLHSAESGGTPCTRANTQSHSHVDVLVGLLLNRINIALQLGGVQLTCCCLRKLWTRCIAASSWCLIRMGIAWAVASSMRLGRP